MLPFCALTSAAALAIGVPRVAPNGSIKQVGEAVEHIQTLIDGLEDVRTRSALRLPHLPLPGHWLERAFKPR